MKIVLFVNSAKTFFWHRKTLAEHLMKQGHEVIVVCSNDGEVSRFGNEKFQTVLVNMSRKGMNPLSEFLLFFELLRIFWKLKPDVCHNFTIKCVIYGSIVQKLTGVEKIVNSITGLGTVFINGGAIQKFVESLYSLSLRFSSSVVIFQNNDDRNLFLQSNLVPLERTKLILGSGVNVEKFYPTISNGSITNIVFGGRLLRTKGIIELIDASIALHHKGILHTLFIAGEIDEMNPDTLTEKDLDIYRKYVHIKILGNVSDMTVLFSNSHIACLPSYREGLPMFLLEAMASGLAILTTEAPGCRELVDGNGYLIPVGDSENLALALEKMIRQPDLIREMGSKSRILAEKKFSQSRVLEEISRLYK